MNADEMFEKLGYRKKQTKNEIQYYEKFGLLIPDSIIKFDLKRKWLNVNFNIDLLELQAINKKVKELKWEE